MAATVGSVNIKVMPSMSGFAKGVDSALGSAGESAGKRFGDGFDKQAVPAAEGSGAKAGSGFSKGVSATGGKGLLKTFTSGLSGVAAKFSGKGSESGKGFAASLATGAAHLGGGLLSAAGTAVSSVHSALTKGGSTAGSGLGSSIAHAFSAKTAAIVGVASGIAQKVLSTVTASIGSAVSRVDTLNNFPKVLQNLGYGADESQASIDTLSDRLSTLPTKLDDAAAGVQMLAPSSKSITQATDRYLAFNDAVLAGGTSEDVQANAMQQLTKAVSTNKMEMDTWMSIQQAMPGQLDQVAKKMLGQKASASDLYKAMKNGKVSVSQFADAIVDLDQNGADGIASFASQAQDAVGGIKTSFSNAMNAFPKGVAKVIGAIGASNIVGVINGFKATVNGAFSSIVEAMDDPSIQAAASGFADIVGTVLTGAADGLHGAFTGAVGMVSAFCETLLNNGAAESFAGVLTELQGAASSMGDAVWATISQITGWQSPAEGAADVANGLKDALDGAQPVIHSVGDAFKWCAENSDQVAPVVEDIAIALVAVKVAGGPVGKLLTAVGKGLLSIGKSSGPATRGMGPLAPATKQTGEAAALSAGQILALGGAIALVGAGVLLASAGLWVIAQAAVQVAAAGPGAAVGMLAMVAAVAGLAAGASVLAPALTAGAVGVGVFGAAVALVGAGIMLACAGILLLSAALPGLAAYGPVAGAGIGALAVPLLALGGTAAVAGAGLLVLSAGFLACGVAGLVCAAAALAVGAGLAVAGVGTALVASTGLTASAALLAIAAAGVVCAAGAVVLTAGLVVCSAGLVAFTVAGVACAAGTVALGVAIAACAVGLGLAAVAVGLIAAGMVTLAAAASVTCGAFNQMAGSLPAVAASGAGAAASLALVSAACPGAAAAGSSVGTGMGGAASAMGTAAAAALVLVARLVALGAAGVAAGALVLAAMTASSTSVNQLGTVASSSFSTFRTSAQSAAQAAVSAVATACARMRSEVSSCRMTLPRISVGALPHFSMSGSFNAQTGSVPSVSVSWYANGAVFGPNSPRFIGIGDNRRYDEAALPLSPQVLGGIGEGVAANMGEQDAVLAWLERRLGPTISRYAPTTTLTEREARRRTREALA